ncbi:NDP-sugar epimerase, includes UDP-GlcNAc-inverting 4,6-dehydratase FlaA1 and capsular polysaccharide biosynthesis protein EpsC [Ruminococcaceae bacterium P7]|nr:NDP-sugar epimerase, includes UDP-GlcNAc-inverting 4,6-dehydratase FlaA1 and capsular polysaccharide biosynthesis protein EpsC [Ruminococcaceae bacterium P7]
MTKFNYRKLILLIADIIIISVSGVILNYILSLVGWIGAESSKGLLYFIILNDLTCVLMLLISGAYTKLWRYFNIKDYIISGISMFVGFVMSYGILMLLGHRPRKVFWALFFVFASWGVLLFRYIFKRTFLDLTGAGNRENLVRTLIVGAGQAGRMILREIENAQFDENNPSKDLLPVGFVDDDITKQRSRIGSIAVLGTTPEIVKICEEHRIENIIVAIPSCDGDEKRRILDICSRTKCKIKVIPYISELIFSDGEQLIAQAKEIKIEDLLGRNPIEFDRRKISGFIKDKVCMVTGGGGSIGSELVRQIAQYSPKQIIIVDIYENNAYDIQQELVLKYGGGLNLVTLISSVRDYDKMDTIFKEYRPQLVFHAAAHKHVPLMETVPEEAVKNNILGTYNVANLAERYKVDKFVMISTDKAVNPTNVMGATKRACEMIIQHKAQTGTHTEFVTTRFGNVLGSNGSVIPLFRKQIESGNPVTVTHPDIIRYFMTIPEAVSLVLEAGAIAKGGEIFVLDMGAPVKITTLAENLIRMYGKVPYKDVPIIFTGLRPGEKLFEELLMDEEGLKSTDNKKIFIGNQIEIDGAEMLKKLERLREAAEANDSETTITLLADMVPTFHHATVG